MKRGILGRLQFINSIDATIQKQTVPLPAGNFSGLILHHVGTNATGKTYQFKDEAVNAIVKVKSEEIVSLPFSFLSKHADLIGGVENNSSASGGAINEIAYIPFQTPKNPNAVHIRRNDNAELKLDLGTVTDISSGSIQIYGIVSEESQNYMPKFMEQNTGSINGTERFPLSETNILQVFLDPSTPANLTHVKLSIDDVPIDEADYVVLRDFQNLFNEVETAVELANLIVVQEELIEGAGHKAELEFRTSGATVINTYVFGFLIDENRYNDSLNEKEARIQNKVQKLALAGRASEKILTQNKNPSSGLVKVSAV